MRQLKSEGEGQNRCAKELKTFVNLVKTYRTLDVCFTHSQGPTETIGTYVTDLKTKAKDCEFGDMHDSLIRENCM